MKFKQAVLIVLTSVILRLFWAKAYKNQVIAGNKRVMAWRRLQVQKGGARSGGCISKMLDHAPLIEDQWIINN